MSVVKTDSPSAVSPIQYVHSFLQKTNSIPTILTGDNSVAIYAVIKKAHDCVIDQHCISSFPLITTVPRVIRWWETSKRPEKAHKRPVLFRIACNKFWKNNPHKHPGFLFNVSIIHSSTPEWVVWLLRYGFILYTKIRLIVNICQSIPKFASWSIYVTIYPKFKICHYILHIYSPQILPRSGAWEHLSICMWVSLVSEIEMFSLLPFPFLVPHF